MVRTRKKHSLFGIVGITLAALTWLLLRTGTRVDRIRYPCQRASLNLVFLGIPLLISLVVGNKAKNRKWSKKRIAFVVSAILMVGMGVLVASNSSVFSLLYATVNLETSYVQNKDLTITELHSDHPVSTLYVAQGKDPSHSLDLLFSLRRKRASQFTKLPREKGS